MPRIAVGWTFVVAISFIGFSGIAEARNTTEYDLPEKVNESDAIFIGRVISLKEPEPRINGVGEYAVVTVEKVIKGDGVGRERKFVVKGFSAELNPDCCQVGETYLFFAKDGYDVFAVGEGEISMSRIGEGKFLSAANGEFSTYVISDERVVGWGKRSDSSSRVDIPKEKVLKGLCHLINGHK